MAEMKNELEIRDGVLIRFNGKSSKACIPEGVTVIGSAAFSRRTRLRTVSLPTGLVRIEPGAFEGCTALCEITVPDTVTEIGEAAFKQCTHLARVVLSRSVTSVPDSAFEHCVVLCDIELPSGILSIGTSAFMGCSALRAINFPPSLCEIGHYAFAGCTSLIEAYPPDSIIRFGRGLFNRCSSLVSARVPNRCSDIPDDTFKDCSSLRRVDIGDSVKRVGVRAFYGCHSLTELKLPKTVEQLCSFCFRGSGITDMVLGERISGIGQGAISLSTDFLFIPNPSCVLNRLAVSSKTAIAIPTAPSHLPEGMRFGSMVGCAVASSRGVVYPTSVAHAYKKLWKDELDRYELVITTLGRSADSAESGGNRYFYRFAAEIVSYFINERLLSHFLADRIMNSFQDNAELTAKLIEYKVSLADSDNDDLQLL